MRPCGRDGRGAGPCPLWMRRSARLDRVDRCRTLWDLHGSGLRGSSQQACLRRGRNAPRRRYRHQRHLLLGSKNRTPDHALNDGPNARESSASRSALAPAFSQKLMPTGPSCSGTRNPETPTGTLLPDLAAREHTRLPSVTVAACSPWPTSTATSTCGM
jgi:hypothetical protein